MKEKILEAMDDGEIIGRKSESLKYRLRSELSQEFLSKKPGFLERWSLLIFAALLTVLFSSTWFVHYPDVINARVTLATENEPKQIVIRQEGHLCKLFVSNNQYVKRGGVIAWIESSAAHKDVLKLSKQIDSVISLSNSYKHEIVFKFLQKNTYQLGELELDYQAMITELLKYTGKSNNKFIKEQKMLKADIAALKKLKANASNQEKILARSNSTDDLKSILQLDALLLTYGMQQQEKLKELDIIEQSPTQQRLAIQNVLKLFKERIDSWKAKYIVEASLSGKISFITILGKNKYLRAGNIIGYISQDSRKYYAETVLSQDNLGKIDTGMQVQLRFDAYPYQEWGTVSGKFDFVSNVPSGNGFPAFITLNNGLITNDGKVLAYRYGLKAQAIIITKDMRLFDRLFFNVKEFTFADK